MLTKEEYLQNPCAAAATAFWKAAAFPIPQNLRVMRERDYADQSNGEVTKYFKLMHNLAKVKPCSIPGYTVSTAALPADLQQASEILSRCYDAEYPIETLRKWTKTSVFEQKLWIFVRDTLNQPIALGIADADRSIGEVSLEWIQVVPEHRRRGVGRLVVNELLTRARELANFVTVSGECDNSTHPERLYRGCGFTGDEIWCVVREKE